MNLIESIDCATVEEFVTQLRPSNHQWTPDRLWVFRGQADSTWSLLPSIWRPKNAHMIRSYLAQHPEDQTALMCQDFRENHPARRLLEEDKASGVDHCLHITVERNIVYEFADFAGRLGFPIDDDVEVLKWSERIPSNKLDWDYFGYPEDIKGADANFFLWAGLAQHHGLPTRLLDWTFNGLKAAFFATQQQPDNDEGPLAVWGLRTNLDPHPRTKNWELKFVIYPPHRHEYLKAQQGLFTFVSCADYYYIENKRWPSVESVISCVYDNDRTEKPVLKKLTLPRSMRDELVDFLWSEEITLAHLMPGYDSIATTLKHRWARFKAQ